VDLNSSNNFARHALFVVLRIKGHVLKCNHQKQNSILRPAFFATGAEKSPTDHDSCTSISILIFNCNY